MKEIVIADMPITKTSMRTSEAIKLFEQHHMKDKTKLFKYRRSSNINIYNLDGYMDYCYGYMAYSTGILTVYDLFTYDSGFVLQLPVKSTRKCPRICTACQVVWCFKRDDGMGKYA